MTIQKETTPLRMAKSRCLTCNNGFGKQLEIIGDEPITQEVLDYIMFGALFHEQHHPSHTIEVMTYENAPEHILKEGEEIVIEDLPIVKDMQARLDAGRPNQK